MKTEEINQLINNSNECVKNVYKTIFDMTKDEPFILFDKDNMDDEFETDELYDLPRGYMVDKYETYEEGAIYKVNGNSVTLYSLADDFGDLHEIELEWLEFTVQLQILKMLNER